jgi:hypothetical protein
MKGESIRRLKIGKSQEHAALIKIGEFGAMVKEAKHLAGLTRKVLFKINLILFNYYG